MSVQRISPVWSGLLLLTISACVSLSTDRAAFPPAAEHPVLYPDSDNLELGEFTRLTSQGTAARRPAASELQMPADFAPGRIFTLIKEPSVLQELERRGFTLGYHLERGAVTQAVTNAELAGGSRQYQSIVQTLEADLNELMASEKRALGDAYVGVGMRYANRVFDARWLRSRIADYQLVGVMNRLDRVAFDPNSCGELRFVYRLGYDQGANGIQSRLPMTLLVKYTVAGHAAPAAEWDLCKRLVRQWTYPEAATPEALVSWMVSPQGPLDAAFTEPRQLHSIEVNMQAFRTPSSIRPGFGGNGYYLMRVFKRNGDAFRPAVLENTPDVEKILANPALHQRLRDLMKDRHVLNRIDAGIWMMPEEFLATRAYSFSPMGLSRQDNRLFHKLLKDSDFNPRHFGAGTAHVKTPDAAIRRLNDLSCVGCHQGRATAGFHFLGIDRKETHAFNALTFEGSGHFQIELIRRNAYMQRVAQNLVPDPTRDFSFAPPAGRLAGQGHFCGLPGGDPSFAGWRCEEGLTCMKVDGIAGDEALGKCFPRVLRAGAPCAVGHVTQGDHRRDTLTNVSNLRCGDGRRQYGCSAVKGGFPSGMCNTSCNGLDPATEVCAHMAGPGFNDCVGSGKSFEKCLDGSVQSGRGLCNDRISCRNDYVCARTGSGAGNCTPSYFLFQIRLDGHPTPVL